MRKLGLKFVLIIKFVLDSKKHKISSCHIDHMGSFYHLGQSSMRMFLSQSYKDTIEKHNNDVRENKKVFPILIYSVFFLYL